MKKGINLLPQFEVESEREISLKKWSTYIGTMLLIIISFLIIVLLILQIRFKKELESLNPSIQKLQENIESKKDIETDYRIIKIKLSSRLKTSSEPSPFLDILQFFNDIKPEGVIFSDITLPDSKKISFSGVSANALSFGELLKNLLDENRGKQKFSSLKLDSFSGGRIGDYTFSFTATIRGK